MFLVLSKNTSGANLLSGPLHTRSIIIERYQQWQRYLISTEPVLPLVWWELDIHSILVQYGSGTTMTLLEEEKSYGLQDGSILFVFINYSYYVRTVDSTQPSNFVKSAHCLPCRKKKKRTFTYYIPPFAGSQSPAQLLKYAKGEKWCQKLAH